MGKPTFGGVGGIARAEVSAPLGTDLGEAARRRQLGSLVPHPGPEQLESAGQGLAVEADAGVQDTR